MKKIIILSCFLCLALFANNAHASIKGSGWYVAPKLMPTISVTTYNEYRASTGAGPYTVSVYDPTGISFGIAVGKDFSKTTLSKYRLELEYMHSSLSTKERYSLNFKQRMEALLFNMYYDFNVIPDKLQFYLNCGLGLALHGLGIEYSNASTMYEPKLSVGLASALGLGFVIKFTDNWALDLSGRMLGVYGGRSQVDSFGYYLKGVSLPFQGIVGLRYTF